MSVRFYTDDARGLLAAFRKAIIDRKVVTWRGYEDGDFTHNPDQYDGKAYMRPKIYSDVLAFGIIKASNYDITDNIYGVFHGRLIESYLTHFSSLFTSAEASPQFRSRDGDKSS